MGNFSKGSEWRKWDLHIHTPSSFQWNGGKRFVEMEPSEVEVEIKKTLDSINKSDVIAFGVVDYWTFDGYLKIREYLDANPGVLDEQKLILPGMEVRIEAPVDYRLNMQVILSNELSVQQLSDFRSELKILASNRKLSDEALISFAEELSPDKADVHGHPSYRENKTEALALGAKTAEITKESFESALKSLPSRDSCLVVLPFDTTDGLQKLDWKKHSHSATYFLKLADVFESRSKDTIQLFLGEKTDKNKAYFENFYDAIGSKPRAVICGSDAHRIADYGNFPGAKCTWIKADPTFSGLRQILNEPVQRTHVGTKPSLIRKVEEDPTRFIKQITIQPTSGVSGSDRWFDVNLTLNPGLTAIIGKKGSGKSALADILALGGNCQSKEFSFLTRKKFRDPKGKLAKLHKTKLIWESDQHSSEKYLSEDPDPNEPANVYYLPQSQLERICNEINVGVDSEFNRELESIIFSHLTDSETIGFDSLDSLLEHLTAETNTAIEITKERISKINDKIDIHRQKLQPSFRLKLENDLDQIKSNISVLRKNGSPKYIKKPTSQLSGRQKKEIDSYREREKDLEQRFSKIEDHTLLSNRSIVNADKLNSMLSNLEEVFRNKLPEIKELAESIDIDSTTLVMLKIKKATIGKIRSENQIKLDRCDTLKIRIQENIVNLNAKITSATEKMNADVKEYESYKQDSIKKRRKIIQLIGDENNTSSARGLMAQIEELSSLPVLIEELKEERMYLVREIYKQKLELTKTYSRLHGPVQEFIEGFRGSQLENKLDFSAEIQEAEFCVLFLSHIHHGKIGSFSGAKEGKQLLSEEIEEADFGTESGVIEFINKIEYLLTNDVRSDERKCVEVKDQIKEGVSQIDIDNLLYSLSYLEPSFSIGWDSKKIAKLSPGQRGNLLLVFYLLIDRSNKPLIIDQPEENLDNETVYDTLVPCIKEARKRRQVVLVTHNPNIAVACDADQIIHASLENNTKEVIEYCSGSIEDFEINRLLVDVLEGTRPAFESRERKYQVSEN